MENKSTAREVMDYIDEWCAAISFVGFLLILGVIGYIGICWLIGALR